MSESKRPTVTLIVGSVGRFESLRRLIRSLKSQIYTDFEVLVVDQVDPVQAADLLSKEAGELRWQVLTSSRGLSRARNEGLRSADARIIGFPDDDCWYEPDTLQRVVAGFNARPDVSVLIGAQYTASGDPVIRTPVSPQPLTRKNVWQVAMSSAVFVTANAHALIGEFDPTLGVGSGTAFLSGEETDFVLRGLAHGLTGWVDPTIVVRHPTPEQTEGRLAASTGEGYGMGMGVVMRRHGYSRGRAFRSAARPAVGAMVAYLHGDRQLAQFRAAVARGRWNGFFARHVES